MTKLTLLISLLIISSINFTLSADISGKELTFKVYRLKVSNIDISNFKSDQKIEYCTYPCQINTGCRWYSRPRSLTAPPFWKLVQEGTGHVIEHNPMDRNKGEYWLYFLPSDATGFKASFAIVFGKGDFFKTSSYPKVGKIESFIGIDEKIGYGDFGSRIVYNIVEKPKTLADKKGTIGGKPCYPYSKFFPYLRGLDFCSIKTKVFSVNQLRDVCFNLETLYWHGEFELHSYFTQQLKQLNLTQRDVSDKVNRQRNPDDSEEDIDDLKKLLSIEEKRRVVKFKEDDGQEQTAYRVFGKHFTFDGVDQLIKNTVQMVQDLYIQENLKLPDFNKDELRKCFPLQTQEHKEKEKTKNKAKIKWEELYNIHTAGSLSYILLDQREVRKVEVCDLLTADEKHRFLIHVKIGTESSTLNHLFGQGYASASLMSQGEYQEEVFIKLLREHLFKEGSCILDKAFSEVRSNLWSEFEKWRKTHQDKKGLLDNIETSPDVEEILKKVDKASETMDGAIKSLEGIKSELDQGTQLIIDHVIETLKMTLESDDSPFSQVEKILREKFSSRAKGTREQLIWESKDFPDKKEDFAEFCIALKDKKIQTKEDDSPRIISLKLEKYRKDLLDDHLKKALDQIAKDLKVQKDGKDMESFSQSSLKTQWDKTIKPGEKIKVILNALEKNYVSNRNHQIKEGQFKLIIENEESLRYFQQLYEYIVPCPADNRIFKVVFAIITDKDPKEPEFIPLNARINLIRKAENIRELNANNRGVLFEPSVIHIKNITKKQKTPQNNKKKEGEDGSLKKKISRKRKRSHGEPAI